MSFSDQLKNDEDLREAKVAEYQIGDYQLHGVTVSVTGILGGLGILLNLSSFPASLAGIFYWISMLIIGFCSFWLIKSFINAFRDFVL